jgi:hypothetical protein
MDIAVYNSNDLKWTKQVKYAAWKDMIVIISFLSFSKITIYSNALNHYLGVI